MKAEQNKGINPNYKSWHLDNIYLRNLQRFFPDANHRRIKWQQELIWFTVGLGLLFPYSELPSKFRWFSPSTLSWSSDRWTQTSEKGSNSSEGKESFLHLQQVRLPKKILSLLSGKGDMWILMWMPWVPQQRVYPKKLQVYFWISLTIDLSQHQFQWMIVCTLICFDLSWL